MSGQSRTFALQAVAVAVVVAIVFFAFLRPSDVDELAGIQAPKEEPFAKPGDGHRDGKRAEGGGESKRTRNSAARSATLVRNGFGPGGGLPGPSIGENPADDQYATTAAVLMSRVRGISVRIEP